MDPCYFACYRQTAYRLAKSHAAVALWKLCFRRLKKDGEKCSDFYGKKCEYTAFFPLRHPERSAAHARGVEWISQRFFLVGLRLAPAVSMQN